MNNTQPITEDYVSFEVAKLLKEKGFGLNDNDYIQLPTFYNEQGIFESFNVSVLRKHNNSPHHLGADTINDFKADLTMMDNSLDEFYLAPTQALVVKWLRVVHGIHVYWVHHLNQPTDKGLMKVAYQPFVDFTALHPYYEKPEKATDAAIKYALNNLI